MVAGQNRKLHRSSLAFILARLPLFPFSAVGFIGISFRARCSGWGFGAVAGVSWKEMISLSPGSVVCRRSTRRIFVNEHWGHKLKNLQKFDNAHLKPGLYYSSMLSSYCNDP